MQGTGCAPTTAIAIDTTRSVAGFDIKLPYDETWRRNEASSTLSILGDRRVLVGRWYRA